ncbi:glycosyltransferase 87 family protein [Terriglobus roseus]|nr:glycosyltransferase family 87 protein [Terriglobus roseus]
MQNASLYQRSGLSRTQWPTPLLTSLFVTVGITTLTLLYALVNHLSGLPHPYSWPFYIEGASSLNPSGDRFGDLIAFNERFTAFHRADFFSPKYGDPFPYPAPVSLFYRLFLPHTRHLLMLAFPVFALLLLIPALLFLKRLIANGLDKRKAATFVFLSLLFSGIVPFEMRQLNAEIFVFIVLAASLYLYIDGRLQVAAILLGVAIALKLYPFMLLGVLFAARRYRAIFLSLLSATATLILGLSLESGSFSQSVKGTMAGMSWFTDHFVKRVDVAIGWDHSIFALVKLLLEHRYQSFYSILAIYTPVIGVIGLAVYLIRIYRMPVFNQIASLVILMILAPPLSFEYTFLQLYSVFAIFCCVVVRNRDEIKDSRPLIWMGACFGFLFALQSMVIVNGRILDGQTKCPVLILLLVLVLTYPVRDKRLDALSNRPDLDLREMSPK